MLSEHLLLKADFEWCTVKEAWGHLLHMKKIMDSWLPSHCQSHIYEVDIYPE